MAKVKITYIGHASFRFESQKGTVAYFDAWLDENAMTDMTAARVKKADVVVASHGHNDHVGDSFRICAQTRAKFVGNYELARQVAFLAPNTKVVPLEPGQSLTYTASSYRVGKG